MATRLKPIFSLQGLPAPVVGAMAENATLFMSYGQLQRVASSITGKKSLEDLTITQRALAAGGAGCITSFVLYVLLLLCLHSCRLTRKS